MPIVNWLPPGKQTFVDINGAPLVGGKVYHYVPNTSMFKDTWLDKAGSALNTNPVLLDARGQAIIYGQGLYRQRLEDVNGNEIWDQITGFGGVYQGLIDSLIIAETTSFPSDQNFVYTAGYYAAGDGGGALYKRVAFEPSTAGKFESADGAWWELAPFGEVLPEQLGAVGDGSEDDTTAWTGAVGIGVPVRGDPSRTYGLYGSAARGLILPAVAEISDARFIDLRPGDVDRRTIYQEGGTSCFLTRVSVDRNGDGGGGQLNGPGTIYIKECPNAVLVDCEVYGDNKGSGIVLYDCDDFRLVRPKVHDMTGGTSGGAEPADDVVQGIFVAFGARGVIDSPEVSNILTQWLGQPPTNDHGRGIAVGGATDLQIIAPEVSNVDQGIDLSGDENPDRIVVLGGTLRDCGTYGGKCANTVTYSRWLGVTALRCGLAGFTCSNWIGSAVQTQDIIFDACVALGTGSNGRWAANAPTGFLVQTAGAPYSNYPRGVRFLGCHADGVGGAMSFGFRSDVTNEPLAGDYWNECVNCTVLNHTVNEYQGINQGYFEAQRDTALAVPNNAFTAIPWDLVVYNRSNSRDGVNDDRIVCKRNGIVQVSGAVSFAANGSGVRTVRLTRNGGQVGRRTEQRTPIGATICVVTFCFTCLVDGGDYVGIEAFQDSGGSLNIPAGNADVVVTYLNFGPGI